MENLHMKREIEQNLARTLSAPMRTRWNWESKVLVLLRLNQIGSNQTCQFKLKALMAKSGV
jgi:hypothetical protein